ncbi:hypothetical protein C2845_PM14G06790 [Panicum miliaceum]|uniref:Uncharacterized protein n=1 Tax=Panicum miliaceum TaxID=4540 RepID=A0A3L6PQ24_PANMI|nr:hypothetical protein C2845_PM14G06790 [Panicum miliaceum]
MDRKKQNERERMDKRVKIERADMDRKVNMARVEMDFMIQKERAKMDQMLQEQRQHLDRMLMQERDNLDCRLKEEHEEMDRIIEMEQVRMDSENLKACVQMDRKLQEEIHDKDINGLLEEKPTKEHLQKGITTHHQATGARIKNERYECRVDELMHAHEGIKICDIYIINEKSTTYSDDSNDEQMKRDRDSLSCSDVSWQPKKHHPDSSDDD